MSGNGWAIIGASTIAREFIVNAIRLCGGTVRWVVSSDREHGESFAAELGIPRATTRLDEALADPEVSCVYIGSANSNHKRQAIYAARAKKNVLCEKPIATTVADAAEMIRACDEEKVAFAVNHHLRASNAHQRMKALIDAGMIGTVHSMTVLNASLLRSSLQTWRIKNADEGGIYLDLTVHSIDLARFLLSQEPISTSGMGSTVLFGEGGIHDHVIYSARMSGGAFLQCHESFVSPNVTSRVTILGSTGSLVAEDTLGQRSGGKLFHRTGQGVSAISFDFNDAYVGTIRAFQDSATRGSRPLATGEDALRSLNAAAAIQKSALLKEFVQVDAPPETPSA